MLIDTMLDLGGLEYDAVDRRLTLQPVLPGSWPQTGISRSFPCGQVTYRLERPIGGNVHRLRVEAELEIPVMLQVQATCPGLTELGPWHASPATPEPALRRRDRPPLVERSPSLRRVGMELDLGLSDDGASVPATEPATVFTMPSGGGMSRNSR